MTTKMDNKIIKRLMFWKHKAFSCTPTHPTKKIMYTATLTIKTSDGVHQWVAGNVKKGARITPFKSFYVWYFCRPDSKYYVMKYDDGETMFCREHIRSFSIISGTKVEE